MSLFVKFNLILVLVFSVALVPAGYISYNLLRSNARAQVIQNARILMETAMATRSYTNRQIKPLLADRARRGVPSPDRSPRTRRRRSSTTSGRRTPSTPTRKRRSTRRTRGTGRSTGRPTSSTPSAPTSSCKEIIGERDGPLGRSLYLGRPIQITDAGLPVLPHDAGGDAGRGGEGVRDHRRLRLEAQRDHRRADRRGADVDPDRHGATGRSRPSSSRSSASSPSPSSSSTSCSTPWSSVRIKRLSLMADQVSTGNLDVPEIRGPRATTRWRCSTGSFNRMRISLVKALKMLEDE